MIQWPLSQFLAGNLNLPAKVAPACSSITSPHCALSKAVCRFPPALTVITDPGAGVSLIALGTVTRGSSAGPSKLPPARTVTLKLPLAVLLLASLTVTVKLKVPAAVGVPARSPLAFIAVPPGVPAEALQL